MDSHLEPADHSKELEAIVDLEQRVRESIEAATRKGLDDEAEAWAEVLRHLVAAEAACPE